MFEGETAKPEPKRTALYLILFVLSVIMVFRIVPYWIGLPIILIISNVPSAILLSQFTANYPALLIGVNIGSVGTLISSLASLITFREYCSHNPKKSGKYIGIFSAFNFSFLIVLTGVMFYWNTSFNGNYAINLSNI